MKSINRLIMTGFIAVLFSGIVFGQRELVIAQGVDTTSFDSHTHSNTSAEAIVVNMMDYLIMMGADGVRQPALATSWEPVSDTAWRFTLREGVIWHDGMPFTAADVKFTFERVATDDTLTQWENFRQIREVEIVDDHEILIHTFEADPIFINRVSRLGSAIVPQHYVEDVGWDQFGVHPIGTGPFRFVEWHRDDRIVMEAFEDHWRGAPAYDRLIHRTIIEDSTRVNELLTGGIHVATNIPPQEEARVTNSGAANVVPWPTTRIMMFIVNLAEDKATGDPLVREAIEYAIDNQLIIDALMDGHGVPVQARVTPGVTASPMQYYDTYRYDPERSVALLEEAGYGPGELTIKLEGPAGRYPLDSETIELIAVMLEAVGINTQMEVLEWSAYQTRIWDADNIENLALIGLANSMFDGWHALRAFTCDGTYLYKTNWCNEEFHDSIRAAEVEVDGDLRTQYLTNAFEILMEERAAITLHQVQNLAGVATEVEWTPRPDELLWMFDARPVTAD